MDLPHPLSRAVNPKTRARWLKTWCPKYNGRFSKTQKHLSCDDEVREARLALFIRDLINVRTALSKIYPGGAVGILNIDETMFRHDELRDEDVAKERGKRGRHGTFDGDSGSSTFSAIFAMSSEPDFDPPTPYSLFRSRDDRASNRAVRSPGQISGPRLTLVVAEMGLDDLLADCPFDFTGSGFALSSKLTEIADHIIGTDVGENWRTLMFDAAASRVSWQEMQESRDQLYAKKISPVLMPGQITDWALMTWRTLCAMAWCLLDKPGRAARALTKQPKTEQNR